MYKKAEMLQMGVGLSKKHACKQQRTKKVWKNVLKSLPIDIYCLSNAESKILHSG